MSDGIVIFVNVRRALTVVDLGLGFLDQFGQGVDRRDSRVFQDVHNLLDGLLVSHSSIADSNPETAISYSLS